MTDEPRDVRPGLRRLGLWSEIGIKGLYISVLSISCIVLVVSVLTAHLFQHSIRSAQLEGKAISLWELVDARDQWNAAKLEKAAANDVYLKAYKVHQELQAEYFRVKAVQRDAEIATIKAMDKLAELLIASGASKEQTDPIKNAPIRDRVKAFETLISTLGKGDEQIAKQLQVFEAALRMELQYPTVVADAQAMLAGQQAELDESKKKLDSASTGLGNFLSTEKADETRQKLLGDYLYQLSSLDTLFFGALGRLATVESNLLTLFLVLAMGTLGGALHLAQLFLENKEDVTAGYYLYRPFLGAIAALVVFVVVRSGVFIIAEPNGQGNGTLLSPFFVSFLAIVSGLLAEQAISSIQDRSASWFETSLDTSVARYPLWVAAEATKQGKDKAAFASAGVLSDGDLQALFDGKTKVSGEVQRLVSFALGKPIRELFTEIPPPS